MAKIDIPDLGADDVADSFDPLKVDVRPTPNSATAQIAIVGEAPGTVEMTEGEPFVGQAGNQLTRICSAISLPRHKIYLTNCCKTQLPQNKSSKLWTPKGYRHPQWGELQRQLINELAEFQGKVIVLAGATAMKMLIDEPRFDSIDRFRGSVYKAETFPHLAPLKGKLIALTNHPASSLPHAAPLNFYIIMGDLQKFMLLVEDPSLIDQEITIHTEPTFEEVMHFFEKVKQADETSFDIEATPRHITCFALTCSPTETMSVPMLSNNGNYWAPENEVKIWEGLAEILGNPKIGKIMQNGMFDIMFVLRTMGIKTDGFLFDTMLAQHICWADLPKGLDFLTSVYTFFPYYKDEGKQTHLKYIKDWPNYWIYNARDAAYTHIIKAELEKEIQKLGVQEVFSYTMALHKPLMEMEWNGIKVDPQGIQQERARLNRKARALQKGINKIAGKELNHNSSKQLITFFYGECQIKQYINRATGRPTCDAVALSRIAKNYLGKKGVKGQAGAVARMISRLRKTTKLVSTYFDVAYDDDERLRCHYKIAGTKSGRLSSEQTFFHTGANLQNQPPAFKKFLVADPETLIVELDLARAEAHVVAFLCQDANMIEAFESHVDVHTYNASKIFHVDTEEVSKEMRALGKRVVHASNYGMGPQTFSDNLAKDDWFIAPKECKELLNAYARRFPGLARWQKQIDDQIYKTRTLYNLFGRPKKFLGKIDGSMMREAYSYIPQSTVAELLNKGMINMYNDPDTPHDQFWHLTSVHDSVVCEIAMGMCWTESIEIIHSLINRYKQHLTHTFTHKGRDFTIGVDAKLGLSWAGKGRTVELDAFSRLSIHNALTQLCK